MKRRKRRHSRRHLRPQVIVILILVPILILSLLLLKQAHTTAAKKEEPEGTVEPTVEPTPTPDDLSTLKSQIEAVTDSAEGEWSVCVEDLSTGTQVLINDKPMISASLIKLFTAGRYFEAIQNGEIRESYEADSYLAAMISQSDNDAWVDLETVIGQGSYIDGLQTVTAFAQRIGCPNTGRLISGSSIYDPDSQNMTTVSEVNSVLRAIHDGTYVNKEASEKILELMKKQDHRWKIPAGIPNDITVANKTGELGEIENDSAIVFGPDTDFSITVMSSDPSSTDHHVQYSLIAEIAKTAFDYLEPSYQYSPASSADPYNESV